ncbi:MAG: hypothetical protein E6H78_14175 [Betaproteobacteria bacterium]|nr:MAG: hypothetical protein E6H78_14175 [Betaproteobacteria bacterium]
MAIPLYRRAGTLPVLARSAFAALIFATSVAAAQGPAVAGVTYGQPKVTPGEYNGDLGRRPLPAGGSARPP